MENNVNYQKQAYQDMSGFLSGKISREDFIRQYKVNAAKSFDYNTAVRNMINGEVPDAKEGQALGLSEAEFAPLQQCQNFTFSRDDASEKLVSAVFEVAYTRTPNHDLGGDGQPASYDRRYNQGAAAERALGVLSGVNESSVGMRHVYNEYFFPRVVPEDRKTGLLSNRSILDSIRSDAKSCAVKNKQLTGMGNGRLG